MRVMLEIRDVYESDDLEFRKIENALFKIALDMGAIDREGFVRSL